MPQRRTTTSHNDRNWKSFVAAAGKHPCLDFETPIALPPSLLDAIREEAPGLLSPRNLKFEAALTNANVFGFFHRRPISYGPIRLESAASVSPQATRTATRMARRAARSAERIREMLDDDLRCRGFTDSQIAGHVERESKTRTSLDRLAAAYAGWLSTDSLFRRSVVEMRKRWGGRINEERRFPAVPLSFFGERPEPDPTDDREFITSWIPFLRRWGLEAMATWDLPVPLREHYLTPHLYDGRAIEGAGLTLFVPWHMLRDRTTTLHAVHEAAEHQRESQPLGFFAFP
jgi:hypothetical protein